MLVASLALALLAQDASPAVAWTELGPNPIGGPQHTGRVSSIGTSATDSNRYFVGGADGGVWRTDDGGATWTPLTSGLPTHAIGAIAVDPTNDDIVYAGTGEANYANHSRYGLGLYKSTDGGATWEQHAEATFGGRTFAKLIIDPTNTQRLFAAIGRAGGFPELAAGKGHPDATGERGIYRSLDGGVTWVRLSLPNLAGTDIAMDPADPDLLYAGIGRIFGATTNGVYRSFDGGDTWSLVSSSFGTGTHGRVSVATAPSQPGRVFAMITDDATSTGGSADTLGVWRSDNSGTSWTQVLGSSSLQSSYGWYLSIIGVDPTNADRVFIGGLNLWRSNNAGGSWTTVTPPHVDMHAVTWDAAGRLLVGDDGGVHRSTSNGNSWTALNNGLGLIQLYAGFSTDPSDPNVIYGGFQDNGTCKRTASGWSAVFGGDGGWTQVDRTNPNRVFVEFQGTGNLYRSTNAGNSFSYVGSGISGRNCFLPPFLIDPSDSNRMLYATERIYRSTNGGSSWSAISGDLTNGTGAIRALAQAYTNSNVVYAATNDGNVLRSDNGGANWTTLLTGQPGWPRVTREIEVHPRKPMKVFLAGAAYGVPKVRRSGNGGATWKVLDSNLPDVPTNVIECVLAEGEEVLFIGTDRGLYWNAGGANWHRYGTGLPLATVIDIKAEPLRGRILVSTQGRGVWSAPLVLPNPWR